MDDLIEFALELLLEGSMELSKNKKVPKWIRYPLIVLLTLFFGTVTVGLVVIGILLIPDSPIGGGLIAIVGAVLLVLGLRKAVKQYAKHRPKIEP